MDVNRVFKGVEYAKDLLQNRPEQDTVDYKVWEVLNDVRELLNDRVPVSPCLKQDVGGISYVCGTCGTVLWTQTDIASLSDNINEYRYCHHCGTPILFACRKEVEK